MNLLHDIPAGDPNKLVNVVIEIPIGSHIKYEYDPDLQIIKADRFLYTAFTYPFNYGFIPRSWSEDDDPVDIVVISSQPIYPGPLVECRLLGVLETQDEEGNDAKIITVPKAKVDPDFAHISEISDLPDHLKNKVQNFFEHYKSLEPGKWIKVTGWQDKDVAIKTVTDSIARYKSHFSK